MLYLIDANVLITAHDQYYPINVVPEFWSWLRHQGRLGSVKMAIENYEEIEDGTPTRGSDPLYDWLQEPECRDALLLDASVDGALVVRVLHEGYAPDLTDDQVEQLGRDPFLICPLNLLVLRSGLIQAADWEEDRWPKQCARWWPRTPTRSWRTDG
ncbi:DUF4411 family protein [Geminicoccus flavidas]|uniref:DUF4411 family protein n=1 Tax=Geminicoccus flavidas TaxID=2506407 RepID=UPI0013584DAA|nr:DUF4411 family protein [Geminicoccus flavidas]